MGNTVCCQGDDNIAEKPISSKVVKKKLLGDNSYRVKENMKLYENEEQDLLQTTTENDEEPKLSLPEESKNI